MPDVKVSERIPVDPGRVWSVISDLSRLGEWLHIHEDWRSEVPEELETGTELTSVIAVRGLRNRVTWTIEKLDPPERISLTGDGKAGTKAALEASAAGEGDGTTVELHVEFSNPTLIGPLGSAAARTLRKELEGAIGRLSELAR